MSSPPPPLPPPKKQKTKQKKLPISCFYYKHIIDDTFTHSSMFRTYIAPLWLTLGHTYHWVNFCSKLTHRLTFVQTYPWLSLCSKATHQRALVQTYRWVRFLIHIYPPPPTHRLIFWESGHVHMDKHLLQVFSANCMCEQHAIFTWQ